MNHESLEMKNAIVLVLLDIAGELISDIKQHAEIGKLWPDDLMQESEVFTDRLEEALDVVFSRFEDSEQIDEYLDFRRDMTEQILFIADELCAE